MRVVQSFLVKNPCYRSGRKITVKGLMLHSVGCAQPKAAVFINSWNRENFGAACVHAFIDGTDGCVYQTLPWNYRGWHCASGRMGSGNNTHIGVEMCEPECITYTGGVGFKVAAGKMDEARAVAARTYHAAVELFAMLCKEYDLNPLGDGVILSHAEGYARGIASNHGDPEHLWRGLGPGYTMDGFRKDVKKALDGSGVSTGYGKAVYPAFGVKEDACPFKVQVKISNLNIRKGPGTNYGRTGKYTGAGVFTIVEVKPGKGSDKGWGRLKSGAGWISLDYCEKM